MILRVQWLAPLFVGFCVAWMEERPVLESRDGNLFISSAKDRNITLKTVGAGYVNLNELDLAHIAMTAQNASRLVEAWRAGILEDMQNTLQRLTTTIEGPSGLERRVNTMQPTLPGTNNNRLRIDTIARTRIRNLTIRLRTLESTVRTIQRKLNTNECESNPCQNQGTCEDIFDGFKCHCPDNWEGDLCTTDVNECARFVGTDLGCQNGATCTNLPGSYQCACTPGWYGIHCTKRSMDCNTQNSYELCGHGVCVNKPGSTLGYTCICDQGWQADGASPACIKDVDECAGKYPACSMNPMVPCINVPGAFYCGGCPQGYTGNGYYCNDIDECSTNNGGCSTAPTVQCINTMGSRICGSCPPGYQGDGVTCAYVGSCRMNNGGCHPLATCVDNPSVSDSYVQCQCPLGYVGNGMGPNGCRRDVVGPTACSSNPCTHGTCIPNGTHEFTCICRSGYTGTTCDTQVDPCEPNPCKNQGTCTSLGSKITCRCTSSFHGSRCERSQESCGGVFKDAAGTLQFPNSPGETYQPSLSCAWRLTTNHSLVLNITFTAFDLENSPNCQYDFLQVHDGPTAGDHMIGRFCGNQLPQNGSIISTHNSLYLWFHSDSSHSKGGFTLHWNTIEHVCGGRIDASHGSINSPGSPGRYPPDRDCYWTVSVAYGKRIQFHFFTMMLEEHPTCENDYLEIKDGWDDRGRQIGLYCNHTHPAPLLTSGSEAYLHFHSDSLGQDAGFQITFASVEGSPGCGGVYTTTSGIIATPNHGSTYQSNMECEWKIQLPEGERLKLTWISFELESSRSCRFDFVEIYGGPDRDAPLIGRYCGSGLPPAIMTDSSVLLVRFKSDYSYNEEGFRLKFEALCGGKFTEDTGVIQSPFYPNAYPASRTCIYEIIQPPGKGISLIFEDMDIEDTSYPECHFDYLSIYDGDNENSTVIGVYCGTNETIPTGPILSTHNYMFLKFVTDASIHNRGFKATYTTVDRRCGGLFKSPSGTIQMPQGDGKYDDNEDCTWTIQAPPGYIVQLTWHRFDIESHLHCNYDYVRVFENITSTNRVDMGTYCGSKIPPVMITQGRTLSIVFHTDSVGTREGFMATYVFIDATKVCGGRFFSLNGVIRSPNYPENYPRMRECVWVIEAPNKQQVKLSIESFEMEKTSGCTYDYLEIRNGGYETSPLIGKYCGTNIPTELTSMSNQIYLKFKSDWSRNYKGFSIEWDSTTVGCGGTFVSASGAITSPNYPQPYGHYADCTWTIAVAAGSVVQFIIIDLELEQQSRCRFDYVEFFDGTKRSGKKLGRYCNNDHPALIKTDTNLVSVRFRSDNSISGRGFYIKYETSCHKSIHGFRGVIESPNFPYKYPHSLNCSWILNAPRGNALNLTFSHFETERVSGGSGNSCAEDYLEVKEGEDDQPTAELGKYCGKPELPLTIASTRNQVFLNFLTDHNFAYNGFRLEWVINGCGGHLTKPEGFFTSPGYPKPYSHNIECEWLIELDVMQSVEITFLDVNLEKMSECSFDDVSVYGGEDESAPKLITLCHTDKPQVYTSTGNKMFVKFYSDFSFAGRGFKAHYKSVDIQCGGKFTTSEGVIHSTNYPKNYPSNQNCEWRIEVDKNHVLNLTFTDFDIEDSTNCTDDYVRIYDGPTRDAPLLGSHCRSTLPPSYVSSSNELLVVMRSDSYRAAKGFKAEYHLACGARIVTSDQGLITLASGLHMQPDISNCSWIIVAKNPSDHVTLTMTHLDVGVTNDWSNTCDYHFIEVREGEGVDGPSLGTWCGKTVPPPITSIGNALTLHSIQTRGIFSNTGQFTATYSVLNSACGGDYTSAMGTIATPGYPNSYPRNVECVWIFHTSPGNRIGLNFIDFDLEESENCDVDYVEARENDGVGKLIEVSCGKNITSIISNVTLWVKFRSSGVGTAKGFKADYSFLHGNDLTGPTGKIASPLYPKPYRQNGIFEWHVTVDFGSSIRITFKEFNIENEWCLSPPHITIYDGYDENAPELLTACGIEIPNTVQTSSNVVFIRLVTDEAWSIGTWFLLEWLEIPRISSDTGSHTTDLDGCNELISLTGQDNSSSHMFSSPGWPGGYADELHCSWIFESPPGSHLVLKFRTLDLEESSTCSLDYVSVASGNPKLSSNREWIQQKRFCMSNSTAVSVEGTNLMKVEFFSDEFVNKTGFQAIVYKECGGQLYGPNGVIEVNETTVTSKRRTWILECQWNVTVRLGKTIEVKVENIDITAPEPTSCGDDYLMLKNGGSSSSPLLGVGKYCGTTASGTLQTTGNQLYVKVIDTRNRAKFKLTYREVGMNCGGNIILSKEQKLFEINSPNYPNIPAPYTECFWTILAPAGEEVSIHFSDRFDLTSSNNCDREYVEIRDGGTQASKILGRFCGDAPPSSLSTLGNMMFIHFYSDVPDPKNGFKASVASGEVCGGIIRGSKGVLKSPNYPETYPKNVTCGWMIVAPPGHTLKLQFQVINLPGLRICNRTDYVSISEKLSFDDTDQQLGTYCGSENPGVIETSGNEAMVMFRSDHRSFFNYKGFLLNFTSSRGECGRQLTGMEGEFSSPGYPVGRPHNRYCLWTITVPEGYQVVVNILDFDIASGSTSDMGQRLWFYHDLSFRTKIMHIRATDPQRRVVSSGNTMTLWYWSSNGGHRGFRARYTATAPAPCGGKLTNSNGVLLPPQGPVNNGSSSFYCEWTLEAPSYVRVHNTSAHTLLVKVSGVIGDRTVVGPCSHNSGIQVYHEKMAIAYICGNLTKPAMVRSPSPVNKIAAIKGITAGVVNFTIEYKWLQCGGMLEGPSHTIESPVTSDYPMDCAWYASFPDNGEAIKMSFDSMNLGSCDESYIIVRNGGPSSPQMNKLCGNIKPADITSHTNELWIEYHAEKSPSSFKFNLEAVGGACGGFLRGRSKDIFSPGFPKQYSENAECVWEISVGEGYHIGLIFIDRFNLETSPNCENDYVQIFNWQEIGDPTHDPWIDLGKVCGRDVPPAFNSTSNRMKVIFRSNNRISGDGFHARWEVNCGGMFAVTKRPKYLTSPGYPGYYGRDLICNYTFVAPKKNFIVEFQDFSLEAGIQDCRFDNLTIVTGEFARYQGTWCSTNKPPIQIVTSRMEMYFMTDKYAQRKGFKLKYHIEGCGGELTEPGVISSPQMAGAYYRQINCTWVITAPPGKSVVLRFEKFHLEYSRQCYFDMVSVYEGALIKNEERLALLCGNLTSSLPVLRTDNNTMTVNFVTDQTDHYGGFTANVLFTNGPASGCGGKINLTQSETFKTQKSTKYEPLEDCHWTILAPDNNAIKLTMSSVDLKNSTTSLSTNQSGPCTGDYIEIRDGAGPLAELIGQYCGSIVPPPIMSSANALWIRLVTDGTVDGTGVTATLEVLQSPCGPTTLVVGNLTQEIISPGFPVSYPPGVRCRWILKQPERYRRKKFTIHFVQFDLEDSERCNEDKLEISDKATGSFISEGFGEDFIFSGTGSRPITTFMSGRLPVATYAYCGSSLPHDYHSAGSEVEISLKTSQNQRTTHNGFKLEYSTATCNRNYTAAQGRILHQGPTDCWFTITAPINYTISLYFNEFTLFDRGQCTASALQVRDGGFSDSVLALLCGMTMPNPIFSRGNKLSLHSWSNKGMFFESYDITYTTTDKGPGCGGKLYNYGGRFTSPMYPGPYRNNSVCTWEVSVPAGFQVALKFHVFDIGVKTTCETDYLQVLDGADSSTYCGEDNPADFHSTGNIVSVQYATSVNNGGSGWVILFTARPPSV